MIKNSTCPWRLSLTKLLLTIGLLLIGIGVSSASLLDNLWHRPLFDLFLPSHELPIADMAVQLQLLATSVVAMLAGGLLGVVSVLLQQLVKNPLASDTTLGIGTGAQLAMLSVTLFVPSLAVHGGAVVAFAGAMASLGLVFAIASASRFNPLVLVLGGLVVNILLASIGSVMVLFFTEQSVGILAWAAGFLTQTNWQTAWMLAAVTAVLALLCVPLLKPLTLMSLDDLQAKRLGVPIHAIRLGVVIITAVVTALVVSEVGLIGFVGLAAASLVNALNVTDIGWRLALAFVFGSLILWLTSNTTLLIGPMLYMPLPAGSMTAVLGAPLVIWLILRQRRQGVGTLTPMLTLKPVPIRWRRWGLGALGVLVVACVFVADRYGYGISTDWALTAKHRLPRTLSAAAAGVMLAVAGVLLQTLARNPMASPEVLGISSGAALGVILGFLFLPAGFWLLSGLSGAVVVLLLVLWLSYKVAPAYLLLVGIGITAMMDSVMNLVTLSGDPRLQAMLAWLSGTTYSTRPQTVWVLMLVAMVLFGVSVLFIKPLKLLSLGSPVARGLGVAMTPISLALLTLVACLSTASTLAVGPLSFIGLMVPHLATSLGAVQLEKQLPLSAVLGAMVMMVADWIGRYVIFPYELPAGTIASLIGGAYFLWLMRKTTGDARC